MHACRQTHIQDLNRPRWTNTTPFWKNIPTVLDVTQGSSLRLRYPSCPSTFHREVNMYTCTLWARCHALGKNYRSQLLPLAGSINSVTLCSWGFSWKLYKAEQNHPFPQLRNPSLEAWAWAYSRLLSDLTGHVSLRWTNRCVPCLSSGVNGPYACTGLQPDMLKWLLDIFFGWAPVPVFDW